MKDQALDSIYFAARGLAPEGRPGYLAEACMGEPALRARVEQMLAVADEAEAFITDPAGAQDDAVGIVAADRRDEIIGEQIGRYKILERLGEGGCGVVYVAEQTEPVQRRVALKIIKLGMDTEQVVARFEAERQALAMMDHPNIAVVHDGGSTNSGRPYFVMELVRGIRITDYCEEVNLSTRDRLDLFIKVCQAIQHAHQKGIIHRDIKPSNILVTLHDGVPVPKVIDFGIAKATEGRLTDSTVYTQLHQFMGTPAYMSPEQAELSGLDIDTRSDIYSLGVLLYELLAGTTPFDTKELLASGLDAMRKLICEKEPVRPSTKLTQIRGLGETTKRTSGSTGESTSSRRQIQELIHQLKGDLDWIVMKCLEKDRTRRYETANALAMDIHRHLKLEPVLARPPTKLYEFQKTVHRHKFGFAATTALILVLTAGGLTSTWQALEATRARKAAIEQWIAAETSEARARTEQKRAEVQLTRAEWLVYAGKLMLAQSDFEDGNGGLALQYLSECQEDRRGWEYRYLTTRINSRQTFDGEHLQSVYDAAFSTDGQRLVTASEDCTAKIWNATTGAVLVDFKKQSLPVTSVAFSPDGRSIITGAGRLVAPAAIPGEAKVWDAETGRKLLDLKGHTDCIWSVACSPDGKSLVTASQDQTAKVWDAVTGEEKLALVGHSGGLRCVAFSPDGSRIATGGQDFEARVWDSTTGKLIHTFAWHRGEVRGLAFSPDGERLVTGSGDKTAVVWEIATGKKICILRGHTGFLRSVAFSPNGRHVATGSEDRTVKVWDAETGAEVFILKGHGGEVYSVAFSPDGRQLLTGSQDRTARVWDAVRGQDVSELAGHADTLHSIAFSPDSKLIVTGSRDGMVKVWDAHRGEELPSLEPDESRGGSSNMVWCVAFSPDGKRLAIGRQDKSVKVWDLETRQVLGGIKHAQIVSGVAFSPDGKRLVSCAGHRGSGGNGEVKGWDPETGEEFFAITHDSPVWSVAYSPDGTRFVAGGDDQIARVWNAATGEELLQLEGHQHWVTSVAFNPDGGRIVTGSMDKTTRVWDAATGEFILALGGHSEGVRGVTFSPDGQRIVTCSEDRTARVWEAATGRELLALKGHADQVWCVAFSPDGQRIATGIAGANATAKVWYAAPPPMPASEQ